MKKNLLLSIFSIALVTAVIVVLNSFKLNEGKDGLRATQHQSRKASSASPPPFPHAEARSLVQGGAFAFLGLGAQANQMNCPAAIESLVKVAGWDGPVYLITDRQECFDKDQIVAHAGMRKENMHMVYTNESFGNIGIDVFHPNIGTRKNRIRSFTMKTRLFDFIKDPSVQTIAYVDCDVLFGIPGCASEFLSAGPSFDDVAIKFTRVDRTDNSSDSDVLGVHAGTFVAHREASKAVLGMWRQELESSKFSHDRDAFMSAYQRGRDSSSGLSPNQYLPAMTVRSNPMNLSHLVKHPTVRFESFVSDKDELYCINHVSKTRCQDLGRDTVQAFVDRFQLESYYGKYKYCPDDRLLPFLYGWFPVSYVPFCPKVEVFL